MEIPENIKGLVKATIGYAECQNKESFIIGTQVAFRKSEEYFSTYSDMLERQLAHFKSAYESVSADMKLIVNTLNKYQD